MRREARHLGGTTFVTDCNILLCSSVYGLKKFRKRFDLTNSMHHREAYSWIYVDNATIYRIKRNHVADPLSRRTIVISSDDMNRIISEFDSAKKPVDKYAPILNTRRSPYYNNEMCYGNIPHFSWKDVEHEAFTIGYFPVSKNNWLPIADADDSPTVGSMK